MIMGIYVYIYIYNMHINIKNRICNHSDDVIKPEKIETKNILINKITLKILFY